MSIHSSLKINSAGVQHRSVLTRIERIKDMMKRGAWTDDKSVIGLPKMKLIKLKAKKTKAKEETAATATAGAEAKPAADAKKDAKPAAKADAKK